VFEAARIVHVDPGLGLLLSLPMDQQQQGQRAPAAPAAAAGFCHVSNLSDAPGQLSTTEVAKRYKVGCVRACVRCACAGVLC
jgi:hypothetical protein